MIISRWQRLVLVLFLALSVWTFGPAGASATVMLSLGIGNGGAGGLGTNSFLYPGPWGFVNVTFVDATHADIELTNVGTTPNFPNVYLYGDGQSFDLNVNGAVNIAATLATLTSTQPFDPATFSSEGAGNVDGFGDFNFRLRTSDGYTDSSSVIKFTLEGSGTK